MNANFPCRPRIGFRSLLVLLLAAGLAGCAVNNVKRDADAADLMLDGYDPVSYFNAPAPQRGSPARQLHHAHGTYRFASDANLAAFRAAPERYAPQYGAFCAKGVGYAIRSGGDPLVYEVRDGRLYIFAVPYARDYWRTDPADFVAKADHYWKTELADSAAWWTNLKRWTFRVPHYKTYPEEFAEYTRRTGKPAPR
jgi:hypothetical protein